MESIAKSQAEQTQLIRQAWEEQHPEPRKAKLVEIGYLDVDAANEKYRKANEAREAGVDLDT